MSEKNQLNEKAIRSFRRTIYGYYREHGRDMPWRRTRNPYHILVSEVMLQQTQVERVKPKYEQFLQTFPDFRTLAGAPLREVLAVWQGLGYNRRAISLRETAGIVMDRYEGQLPSDPDVLATFPGIGQATASAIAAFAFGLPSVFMETNIRRVFIHFFFKAGHKMIRDADIRPLVEQTLDAKDPRAWYYALMDYGVMLGRKGENANRRSAHHRKQSRFEGSNRQVRGLVLKALTARQQVLSARQLASELDIGIERIATALNDLEAERFVEKRTKGYRVRQGDE
ncbi:MAG: endonuclease III [Candidatus Abyssubacteria bacterium]